MIKRAITKSHHAKRTFYRDKLSDNEAEYYNILLEGLMRYEQSIQYRNLDIHQIERVYEVLKLEVPQLFFVKKITCQHVPVLNCGLVVPQYRFSEAETYATLNAIQLKAEEIIKHLTHKSEYEKEIFIHDYLCKNVKYDYSFRESSFECVGPILFGKGVCEGISKAAKLLFDSVGINSIIVHGKSNNQRIHNVADDSHAWNIVVIDNSYYHLDITFDLSIMTFGVLRYDYFNLSTEDVSIDHMYDKNEYPHCSNSRNYYIENNMYMANKVSFKSYFDTKIKQGEKNVLIKLPPVTDIRKARDEIIDIVQKCFIDRRISVQYQIVYNENQRVFLLHID